MSRLPSLPRQRASDSVYQALRTPSSPDRSRPASASTSRTSRSSSASASTPVKDALTRLEAEALIEIRPRSGTYVTAVSPEDVAETFELRCALECLAAEKALARIAPADIDRLRTLAARHRPGHR